MGYKLSVTNGQKQYGQDEWIVDTTEDLKKIPNRSQMGSIALVISTSAVYVKNGKGEWEEIAGGNYSSSTIDLSGYVKTVDLAPVAFSGSYNDLIDKPEDFPDIPDLNSYVKDVDLARVAFTGDYNDLINSPTFSTVAISGDYNDLINKPEYVIAGQKDGTILGDKATAEGYQTTSSGSYSHAEGYNTTANHLAQHVFGCNNIEDDSTNPPTERGRFVEIVGNGTEDNPSNARTLDWEGNEEIAGNMTVKGGTIQIGDTILTEEKLNQIFKVLEWLDI